MTVNAGASKLSFVLFSFSILVMIIKEIDKTSINKPIVSHTIEDIGRRTVANLVFVVGIVRKRKHTL